MAIDPDEFLVQGLASLLGGLLAVSAGAWMTGFYKIKGEITGRAERLDEILNEVRETAKATEGAKITARLAELDQILLEVRAVTETQKRIEASIAGGEWDRQWRLNQMREAYGRLLKAVYDLQDYYYVAPDFAGSPSADGDAESQAHRRNAAEFKTAGALTRIFAGSMAAVALDEYEQRLRARVRMSEAAQPKQALKDLGDLHNKLLQAARQDLHV